MINSFSRTTILFEDPFWIALFERNTGNDYSVARVVIGSSEPSGTDILDFFNKFNHDDLQYTFTVKEEILGKKISFKKQQHKNKQEQDSGFKHAYTKAHAMLKQQQTINKIDRKNILKSRKDNEEKMKFDMKQKKKKEKHKGH